MFFETARVSEISYSGMGNLSFSLSSLTCMSRTGPSGRISPAIGPKRKSVYQTTCAYVLALGDLCESRNRVPTHGSVLCCTQILSHTCAIVHERDTEDPGTSSSRTVPDQMFSCPIFMSSHNQTSAHQSNPKVHDEVRHTCCRGGCCSVASFSNCTALCSCAKTANTTLVDALLR